MKSGKSFKFEHEINPRPETKIPKQKVKYNRIKKHQIPKINLDILVNGKATDITNDTVPETVEPNNQPPALVEQLPDLETSTNSQSVYTASPLLSDVSVSNGGSFQDDIVISPVSSTAPVNLSPFPTASVLSAISVNPIVAPRTAASSTIIGSAPLSIGSGNTNVGREFVPIPGGPARTFPWDLGPYPPPSIIPQVRAGSPLESGRVGRAPRFPPLRIDTNVPARRGPRAPATATITQPNKSNITAANMVSGSRSRK
jgi:hypothetical protein